MDVLRYIWELFDDRTGASEVWKRTAGHLVPPGTGWWYVFGSATLAAFIVQVVTGIALASVYTPSTESAYSTLQFISQQAAWGHLLRGLHYFGASAMILLIGIHVSRTYLMGSYKYPRELNWLTGAVLLVLVVVMGFTGQLLRWDQIAVWSVYIAAEQAGRVPFVGKALAHFILAGDQVGGATLTRFFAFHVFFIPALIFGFIGIHLYLVIRNGISEPPKPGRPVDTRTYRAWYEKMVKREGHPFWPSAAWRDVTFGVGMITVLVILAWFIGAPHLSRPPDPTILKAEPRPDWYLLWYYALLALLPHGIEPYVMVLGPLGFGLLLILLPLLANKGERSAWRRPWAIGVVILFWTMIVTLWIQGKKAPWSPAFAAKPLPASVIRASSGPVYRGGQLFHSAGCEACHNIAGYGGHRGPDLTTVGDRLTGDEITIRIVNGATNMPAFGGILSAKELNDLVAFLKSRKTQ
ncbi:MAG TPA: cytochrome b N-terminal domain-containing protein [Terriglobia bacterium]|nr:cytochrome b N-terminal domain-containing protein [Terriglobia bacterium]